MTRPSKKDARLTQRAGWRLIFSTAFAAVICWLAALAMLRGVAQTTPEPATAPDQPAVTDTNEEETTSRRVLPQASDEAELPEFRDSADNNVSFPVDI